MGLPSSSFGKVWFPQDKIVLGVECAEHILDILRHKRKVAHCVLTELSHFLEHKSGMSVENWSGRQQALSISCCWCWREQCTLLIW